MISKLTKEKSVFVEIISFKTFSILSGVLGVFLNKKSTSIVTRLSKFVYV